MRSTDVRFARNGEISIGYAVFGEGAIDIVFVPVHSNLEVMLESESFAAFVRRLSTFSRLILVDRRGAGVSDRYSADDTPPFEDLADDLVAVLDAAGSARAVLFGFSDTGAMCAMLAARSPDRVRGLVLCAVAARGTRAPDYPWQWSDDEWAEYLDSAHVGWGTPSYSEEALALYAPSLAGDARETAWFTRLMRVGLSPGACLAQEKVFRDMDIRRLLPAIGVPALVLHRTGDMTEPVGAGRYVAGAIPGARYVELEGSDHWPWAGDQAALVREVERFVTDLREDEEFEQNRVLATVLFTDIVDSTAQAATLGDRRWREVRDQHDRVIRGQLARHRGVEVKTMGDGFIATFDGPARGVRCARAICGLVQPLGIQVRAGLHTGEIELDGGDIAGIAVAIGARVGALASGSEVLVSSTVKDLVVGSGLAFSDRGEHVLKGVDDAWRIFAAVGP